MVRQAPVICVMDLPIQLGAWSMATAALLATVILRRPLQKRRKSVA